MDGINIEGLESHVSPDVWRSPDDAAPEIKRSHQPVDYSHIVGDAKILLLGDSHYDPTIRYHIGSHSTDLRKAGITHYAIEASEQGEEVFDSLNRGEQVDLTGVDIGPEVNRESYEHAIRSMAAQGIKVVPVDIDRSTNFTDEQREARMTANLQRILNENPDAKVAYLVGALHTSKRSGKNGIDLTGKRLVDAGVKTVTVGYAGGTNSGARIIREGAQKVELAYSEFALDMRPYTKPSYGGEVDYVVHLPQDEPRRAMRTMTTYRRRQ